jgi:4-amino-4-deoxy-L-arabinose transferase-like glycosyltransferase
LTQIWSLDAISGKQPTLSSSWIERIAASRLTLIAILVAAFALRVFAAVIVPDQSVMLGDAVAYREVGKSLWATGQMNALYFMPLYPALVAVFGPGWPQLLIDIALSTALVWLIYELTDAIFASKRAAVLAAAVAAVYPYFIFYSIVGLTETLFMVLLLSAYLCWYRNAYIAASVFSVLGILTRPVLDPLAPLLLLYFAIAIRGLSIKAAAKYLAIYVGIYCVLMAPWWLHNYKAYQTFVRLNLGSGVALLSGNSPSNQSGGIDNNLNATMAPFAEIADPVARDKAMQRAALNYIKEDPGRFLIQAAKRFQRFWSPWPLTEEYSRPLYKLISFCSFIPVLLLALVIVVLYGRTYFRRIAPLLLFIVYLNSLHLVFPASLRYRLPVEPFLIILAAAGAVHLVDRWSQKKPSRERLAAA